MPAVKSPTDSTARTGPRMSREEVVALARNETSTNMVTACRAHGIGSNLGYELHARGELPFRVVRLGRKLRVPTASLLESLGITLDAPGPAGAA